VATWLKRETKFGKWNDFYFALRPADHVLQKFDQPDGKLLREYELVEDQAVLDMAGGYLLRYCHRCCGLSSPPPPPSSSFAMPRVCSTA
jgi:hypothetical protein